MRRKTLGTIYLVIGLFLSIYHPIFSVLTNKVYAIGFYVPLNPLAYWSAWMWEYGLLAIVLAVIGVYFLIIGYRYVKSSAED